jgi:hypothetical protein
LLNHLRRENRKSHTDNEINEKRAKAEKGNKVVKEDFGKDCDKSGVEMEEEEA